MTRNIDNALLLKGKATVEEVDPDTDEVISSETKENVIVDVAGAETIAGYIAGNTPSDFVYMILGTGNASAPSDGDTDLETRVDTSPSLTASIATDGGASKKVVWSNTFSSGTGKTSIVELGMFDGTATAAGMLNRLTCNSKDNTNNDLKITYELTVS